MSETIYPVLDPPAHLTNVGPHETWSLEVAQARFDWLMSVWRNRVRGLLTYFDCDPVRPGTEHDFLIALGPKVAEALRTEPNYREENGKKELAGPGLSMAYDMALLVAALIIDSSNGVVRWKIDRSQPLSADYNLPVLVGRPKDWFFGVTRGSIVEAIWVLRGKQTSDIWARSYSHWLPELTAETVKPLRERPRPKRA